MQAAPADGASERNDESFDDGDHDRGIAEGVLVRGRGSDIGDGSSAGAGGRGDRCGVEHAQCKATCGSAVCF